MIFYVFYSISSSIKNINHKVSTLLLLEKMATTFYQLVTTLIHLSQMAHGKKLISCPVYRTRIVSK